MLALYVYLPPILSVCSVNWGWWRTTCPSRVKELMEAAVELDVLLEVEIGAGDNWDQAH